VKIEAFGKVDFQSGDKSTLSDKALYDVKSGMLTLTDNVVLRDGDNYLEGGIFRYNVRTGKSEVNNRASVGSGSKKPPSMKGGAEPQEDTGKRVRATFTPGEDIQKFDNPVKAINGVRGQDLEVINTDPDKQVPDEDKNSVDRGLEKQSPDK
jgi:lipopolysaccharide export system protein LptA